MTTTANDPNRMTPARRAMLRAVSEHNARIVRLHRLLRQARLAMEEIGDLPLCSAAESGWDPADMSEAEDLCWPAVYLLGEWVRLLERTAPPHVRERMTS